MSDKDDKLISHLNELRKKHRNLDSEIKDMHSNKHSDDEIRRLKTYKLWLKDEIYRIETQLTNKGLYINGYH